MKYHLKKKKSFFNLFRSEITLIAKSIIILTIGSLGFIYKDEIIVLLKEYGLDYKTIIIIAVYTIPLIMFIVPLIYKCCLYLYRHTYIPLTDEELKLHNIHTHEEYDVFLEEFFMGIVPLKRVRSDIKKVSENFKDQNSSICKRLYFEKTYYKSKNKTYFSIIGLSICMTLFFMFVGLGGLGKHEVANFYFLILGPIVGICTFYFSMEIEKKTVF